MQKLIAGAVCAAALLSAGSAAAQATPQSYRYNWTPAGTLTPAPSPMDFLMLAGGGDLYEIQSSQAVLETTQNPEVRRFAQMMIDHHTKTTADAMAAARRDGVTPPPAMLAQHQAAMVNALKMFQGVERDRLYLTQQQMAHKEALGVQKTYSEAGTSPALKAAATATVPIVQRHLAEVDRMIAAARRAPHRSTRKRPGVAGPFLSSPEGLGSADHQAHVAASHHAVELGPDTVGAVPGALGRRLGVFGGARLEEVGVFDARQQRLQPRQRILTRAAVQFRQL